MFVCFLAGCNPPSKSVENHAGTFVDRPVPPVTGTFEPVTAAPAAALATPQQMQAILALAPLQEAQVLLTAVLAPNTFKKSCMAVTGSKQVLDVNLVWNVDCGIYKNVDHFTGTSDAIRVILQNPPGAEFSGFRPSHVFTFASSAEDRSTREIMAEGSAANASFEFHWSLSATVRVRGDRFKWSNVGVKVESSAGDWDLNAETLTTSSSCLNPQGTISLEDADWNTAELPWQKDCTLAGLPAQRNFLAAVKLLSSQQ